MVEPTESKSAEKENSDESQSIETTKPDEVFSADTVGHVALKSTDELSQRESGNQVELKFRSSRRLHLGPLPDAETLREFKKIYPDAAKLIFEDFHAQSKHRRELEASVVATKNALAIRGQRIGGLLGFTGLIGSFVVIGMGHDYAGVAIATTTVVSLAGLFLYTRNQQSKELGEKARLREQIRNQEPLETVEGETPVAT